MAPMTGTIVKVSGKINNGKRGNNLKAVEIIGFERIKNQNYRILMTQHQSVFLGVLQGAFRISSVNTTKSRQLLRKAVEESYTLWETRSIVGTYSENSMKSSRLLEKYDKRNGKFLDSFRNSQNSTNIGIYTSLYTTNSLENTACQTTGKPFLWHGIK